MQIVKSVIILSKYLLIIDCQLEKKSKSGTYSERLKTIRTDSNTN